MKWSLLCAFETPNSIGSTKFTWIMLCYVMLCMSCCELIISHTKLFIQSNVLVFIMNLSESIYLCTLQTIFWKIFFKESKNCCQYNATMLIKLTKNPIDNESNWQCFVYHQIQCCYHPIQCYYQIWFEKRFIKMFLSLLMMFHHPYFCFYYWNCSFICHLQFIF